MKKIFFILFIGSLLFVGTSSMIFAQERGGGGSRGGVGFLDSDGDGSEELYDNCPTVPNSQQEDADDDGVGDACDNCPHIDNLNQDDADKDGVGDVCDLCLETPVGTAVNEFGCSFICSDSDTGINYQTKGEVTVSSVPSSVVYSDECLNSATLQEYYCEDGKKTSKTYDCSTDGEICSTARCCKDSDGDFICDLNDNCPAVKNLGQEDFDDDGIGDACDEDNDNDNDGCSDGIDKNPLSYSKDSDEDGISDDCDNCPFKANRNQEETECQELIPSPIEKEASDEGLRGGQEQQTGISAVIPEGSRKGEAEDEILEKERESLLEKITLPQESETGKVRVKQEGGTREINIGAARDVKTEITDDNNLLIKKEEQEFKVKPNFERLIFKYVGKNETIEELKIDIEDNRPVYRIEKTKRATLLWLFPVNLKIETWVDAKDLKLVKEKKPWWKFLITKGDEPLESKCGDKVCEKDEGSEICPEDCGALCSNGICEIANHLSCPWDCQEKCGDGVCDNPEKGFPTAKYCKDVGGYCETIESCPEDCAFDACGNKECGKAETGVEDYAIEIIVYCPYDCGYCGDGVCGIGEFSLDTFHAVCADCEATCGNKVCEPGENPQKCHSDCGATACGDGECEFGESPTICPEDCSTACGNGICDIGENPDVCVADCGACGDGVCQGYEETKGYCPSDCQLICGNSICEGGQTKITCPYDCLKCKNCNCGDGICEGEENKDNCPADCEKTCGDGTCSIHESILSCAKDCKNSCGDGVCDKKDLKEHCEIDCSVQNCGDGVCSAPEITKTCPQDCKISDVPSGPNQELYEKNLKGYCGDNICKGTETIINCPVDCEGPCGNGICDAGENSDNCQLDCGLLCGDGTCNKGEDKGVCLIDCGYCGDGVCLLPSEKHCPSDCGAGAGCGDGQCGGGENPDVCPYDCQPVCGNALCDDNENPTKCPTDCANPCGNNICDEGESYLSCPWDCSYCGDSVCGNQETEENCSKDCTSACGNSICEKDESTQSCPYDCTSS